MEQYYHVLNLRPGAKAAAVKKSFRQLALRFHPDKNQDSPEATMKFQEITEAYEAICRALECKGMADTQKKKWMDEIRSHHFETMGSHCLLVLPGNRHSGFLRWCRISSIHSMSNMHMSDSIWMLCSECSPDCAGAATVRVYDAGRPRWRRACHVISSGFSTNTSSLWADSRFPFGGVTFQRAMQGPVSCGFV